MLERKHWHPKVTDMAIIIAVQARMHSLSSGGFCLVCGTEHVNVEPDAREYECEACGTPQVYGADELLQEIF